VELVHVVGGFRGAVRGLPLLLGRLLPRLLLRLGDVLPGFLLSLGRLLRRLALRLRRLLQRLRDLLRQLPLYLRGVVIVAHGRGCAEEQDGDQCQAGTQGLTSSNIRSRRRASGTPAANCVRPEPSRRRSRNGWA